MGVFDKDYSVSELEENFDSKKEEIMELKAYYNSIVPENKIIEIEFTNDESLNRFGIYEIKSTSSNHSKSKFLGWNIDVKSKQMDSLLQTIHWTQDHLIQLKDKLDSANCIQITNGEPTKIGFKRCAMSMYSFNVFSHPISEQMSEKYNDSCTYILVNETLALQHSGGAMGPQCFYNFK